MGKSAIFHLFSVLTDTITIQIIPIIKLGEEQLKSIETLPEAKPCLVTGQTRLDNVGLFTEIANAQYSHILLGPEQAVCSEIRDALKSLFNKVRLVAIDECHLVKQWEIFLAEFAMLKSLREVVHEDCVTFACSATIDAKTEEKVLQHSGLRQVGLRRHQTAVIRTSVDRPDISICVHPLPKGHTTDPATLFFTIQDSVDNSSAVPAKIPKTIMFIDNRPEGLKAAEYLQRTLVSLTSKFPVESQYKDDPQPLA
jgi:superfamily II DNA helicase RecQ